MNYLINILNILLPPSGLRIHQCVRSCQAVPTTLQLMIRERHFLGTVVVIYHTAYTHNCVS